MAVVIYALLARCSNTGAKGSGNHHSAFLDVRLQTPPHVRLFGKGRKERVCPCGRKQRNSSCAAGLRGDSPLPEDPLFRNQRCSPSHPVRRPDTFLRKNTGTRCSSRKTALASKAPTPAQHENIATAVPCCEPASTLTSAGLPSVSGGATINACGANPEF